MKPRVLIGFVLFAASLAVFNLKLVDVIEVGTCASGNVPYEISQPCPEGTAATFWLMFGSCLGALVGGFLFAWDGLLPGRELWGRGTLVWSLAFVVTGTVSVVTAVANDSIGPDGELGAWIAGVTFLVMGLPALGLTIRAYVQDRRPREPAHGPPQLG